MLGCVLALNAADQGGFQERNPLYRLQSSDTIEVAYRYTPEYNSTVSVQPDGYVSLQIVGQVKVSGLTAAEAAQAVARKAGRQLNKPEVTVLIKDFVHPFFVVAGDVAHPGRFEMHGAMNAIEAIAISGGFTESSKHSQVVLVRKFNSEYAQVSVLNVKKMMKANDIRENPEILPGDMLVVPQNTVSKLERYIRWTSSSLYGIAVLR
jgi:polysaccharide export outer membrane protein